MQSVEKDPLESDSANWHLNHQDKASNPLSEQNTFLQSLVNGSEMVREEQGRTGMFGAGETVLSSIRGSHSAAAALSPPLPATEPTPNDAVQGIGASTFAQGDRALRIDIPNNLQDNFIFSPSDLPASANTLSGGLAEEESPTDTQRTTSSPRKRNRSKAHTPRPANSFILYRREKHVEIMAQYKGDKTLNNNVISKIVANMWRSETPDVKALFAAKADAEKKDHMLKFPDYKYRPRKSPTKRAESPAKSPNSPLDTNRASRKSSITMKDAKARPVERMPDSGSISRTSLESPLNREPKTLMPMFPAHYAQPYVFNDPYAFPPGPRHYPMHIMPTSSAGHHHMTVLDGNLEGIHGNQFGFGSFYETGQEFFPKPSLLPPGYGHVWPGSDGVVWESNEYDEEVVKQPYELKVGTARIVEEN